METITRKEANARGLKQYFTGKPCKYGHVAARLVSNKTCLKCSNDRKVAWGRANPQRMRSHRDKWAKAHPNEQQACRDSWAERNSDRLKVINNALESKRRAAKLQRTPAWADYDAIIFFYECCPAGCHVDHIVPLQGKYVSGLHVAENLQWLPDSENCKKRNKFDTGDEFVWELPA